MHVSKPGPAQCASLVSLGFRVYDLGLWAAQCASLVSFKWIWDNEGNFPFCNLVSVFMV